MFGQSCFPGPVTGVAGSGLQIQGGQEVHADFTLSQVTGAHVRGTLVGRAANAVGRGDVAPGPNPPDPTAIDANVPNGREWQHCAWRNTASAGEKRTVRFSKGDDGILYFAGQRWNAGR